VPRKPTLSPSKISTYLACPLKYRWTYIDDRGRWYLRAKSYYSFGSTLHKVLEQFHDGGDTGVTTVEQVIAAYEESWISAGYSSAEEMQEAFGEGREILERYVGNVEAQDSPAKVLLLEKQLRMPFGDDFDLIGRIDRVDEYPDGTLEIIDYKSGRDSVRPEDIESDLAMAIYQLLVRHEFPGRPIKATIVALRTGVSASFSHSDQALDEFRFDLHELGRSILGANWEERFPQHKSLCSACDFQPLCREHQPFATELASAVDQGSGT
jgi:putative RecB family exonuclease